MARNDVMETETKYVIMRTDTEDGTPLYIGQRRKVTRNLHMAAMWHTEYYSQNHADYMRKVDMVEWVERRVKVVKTAILDE